MSKPNIRNIDGRVDEEFVKPPEARVHCQRKVTGHSTTSFRVRMDERRDSSLAQSIHGSSSAYSVKSKTIPRDSERVFATGEGRINGQKERNGRLYQGKCVNKRSLVTDIHLRTRLTGQSGEHGITDC